MEQVASPTLRTAFEDDTGMYTNLYRKHLYQ